MIKINNFNKSLYLVLSLSIFLDLYFNIDSAGSGGFEIDFNSTWPLIEKPLEFTTRYDIKFPLHYYIASIVYKIVNDKELLRFIYCVLSLPIPYMFFLCLKTKYKNININNLFLFSLIIFLMPSFRSAAVWPNTQITAIFFFLISLLFFLKWELKNQRKKINRELFLTILFMSLTVYSRQIYALVFFFFMIVFYLNLSKEAFIKTALIVGLLALPGLAFVLFWPKILKATFEFKLYNSLLVNASIISFYLIPFFSILFFYEKKIRFFKIFENKKIEILLILSFVLLCSMFFNYNYLMGGGYFIKLSKILFDNLYLFFFSSFVGFVLMYILSVENKLNLILNLIIITAISAWIIFMKYHEPMYLILLFLIMKTKFTNIFLKNRKYIYLYHIYFIIYLSTAIINNYLLFSKNI